MCFDYLSCILNFILFVYSLLKKALSDNYLEFIYFTYLYTFMTCLLLSNYSFIINLQILYSNNNRTHTTLTRNHSRAALTLRNNTLAATSHRELPKNFPDAIRFWRKIRRRLLPASFDPDFKDSL